MRLSREIIKKLNLWGYLGLHELVEFLFLISFYPNIAFRSASGVVMGMMLNLSTST